MNRKIVAIFLSIAFSVTTLVSSSFAQTIGNQQRITQARRDITNFYSQWRSANPKEAFTSANLHRYVLEQRQSKQAAGTKYPSLGVGNCQPLDVLPDGGWLLGFITLPSNAVGAIVDINTNLPNSTRTHNLESGIKIFVLNQNGQFTEVLN